MGQLTAPDIEGYKVENKNQLEEGNANARQVGGTHYKTPGKQSEHWDLVIEYGWDYFQGQIIKYLMRWRLKNGIEDLEKARHYLDKYIEAAKAGKAGYGKPE
jgi:hypothetical protein